MSGHGGRKPEEAGVGPSIFVALAAAQKVVLRVVDEVGNLISAFGKLVNDKPCAERQGCGVCGADSASDCSGREGDTVR